MTRRFCWKEVRNVNIWITPVNPLTFFHLRNISRAIYGNHRTTRSAWPLLLFSFSSFNSSLSKVPKWGQWPSTLSARLPKSKANTKNSRLATLASNPWISIAIFGNNEVKWVKFLNPRFITHPLYESHKTNTFHLEQLHGADGSQDWLDIDVELQRGIRTSFQLEMLFGSLRHVRQARHQRVTCLQRRQRISENANLLITSILRNHGTKQTTLTDTYSQSVLMPSLKVATTITLSYHSVRAHFYRRSISFTRGRHQCIGFIVRLTMFHSETLIFDLWPWPMTLTVELDLYGVDIHQHVRSNVILFEDYRPNRQTVRQTDWPTHTNDLCLDHKAIRKTGCRDPNLCLWRHNFGLMSLRSIRSNFST